MNYESIDEKILDVYKECNIKSFPLDVKTIIKQYKLSCYSYSCQDQKFKEFCFKMSDDAFSWEGLILYNDEIHTNRQTFSLAHELGHYILGHAIKRSSTEEQEANYFASHILAPRMAVHYSRSKNHVHVSRLFNISLEAAEIAFDDYRRWHRKVVYKMNGFDKNMYAHFYNENIKGFAYSIKKCKLCGKELINDKSDYCDHCFNRLSYIDHIKNDKYYNAAENHWLYGGL